MSEDKERIRSWLALLATSQHIKKSVDTKLRGRFGMSISRFDVLAALDRAGPDGLRAGALTARLMASDGNTTQVTAPLIRDGLVKRSVDPSDGRVAIFTLTKKGQKIFADMADEHRRWINDAFGALPPAKLKTLRQLLAEISPDLIAHSGETAA